MRAKRAWSNWSGNVSCFPGAVECPGSEADLQDTLARAEHAGVNVRAAGSGHSFAPLCNTDGVLVNTERLKGVVRVDPERLEATFGAGTRISEVGEKLLEVGMALENQGDIDEQTLSGSISTGTHGTGVGFGSLSASVSALRMVLASGEILECSETSEREMFRAARLSLGLLGVISEITLRVVPAYRLHERTQAASVGECLDRLDADQRDHRHYEFYWLPGPDRCAIKTLVPTEDEPRGEAPAELAPPGTIERYVLPERMGWSHEVFPSERATRFNEMEYAVALADGPDCFLAVRRLMRDRHPDVAWAVEYRTQRADDVYLSPAFGRDVATISVHQAGGLPYAHFFRDAEAVFRGYRGRPHWGKVHYLGNRELAGSYPAWDAFRAVRERLDPGGRFMNADLRKRFVENGRGT